MIQQIDAPLREDVRLLGNLLGETLKEHAGQDLFNQVEQIRALSKGARDGQVEAEKQRIADSIAMVEAAAAAEQARLDSIAKAEAEAATKKGKKK